MRKDGWTYWTTGLPDASEAFQDLQRLADELGVTKAEATRLLLIAYSKASRGEWSQLWGFSMAPVITSPYLVQNGKGYIMITELQHRRLRSAAAAAVALYLEE